MSGMRRRAQTKSVLFWAAVSVCFSITPATAQLNQNCVVAVLNRTVQANSDGTWILPNVPANFGFVRARATCVQNGITTFGQSALFSLAANGTVNLPQIQIGNNTPIPTAVNITAPATVLSQTGATDQLAVTATYASGSPQNITQASTGTQYNISNPAIATINANGLVTAVSSGTVLIQAVNEGAEGIITVQVVIGGASNGGIPDSWIISSFCPNFSQGAPCPQLADPTFASEDPDRDGLTNLQEFQLGTNPNNPDTDGDGLTDRQEVMIYHTNPLLFSTDGTGVSDGIEVQTGTMGLSLSQKLAKAISTFTVTPASFVLDVNSIQGLASQQLSVKALLIDGKTTLDLTSTLEGTSYSSSDLTICNFGAPDGNVFAGNNGACTITVTNSGFTATATGTVIGFTPTPLSFVSIPGFANGVAVNGNYAFVAAGAAGLQVVNVGNRSNPVIVASLALAGNANDVRLLGNLAYVAAGSSGLEVVDVTNPLAPVLRGTLSTGGAALEVAVRGTTAYVANTSNLFIADVTNPASMAQTSTLPLSGTIRGLDVDAQRNLAVVAAGTGGIYVVDVSNPAVTVVRSQLTTAPGGESHDVAIKGTFAFIADYHSFSESYQNSLASVDISNPSSPVMRSAITDSNLGGNLNGVVISGNFALGADVIFVNGIPITDITDPTNLISRAILNFPEPPAGTFRDDNGMGIAVDGSYAYLATEHSALDKFGSSGDSRLYIGQYLALVDNKGIPPTAAIAFPANGSTVIQGATLPITVNATDDVAVAAVNFLVNGQVAFTTTASASAATYQYNLTVPTGILTLTLGATAVDFGGNIGTAQNVLVQVIPDPLTTVVGTVVDQNGNAVSGAAVAFGARTTTTGSTGSFSLSGVPTVQGNIVILASATINSRNFRGASAPTPPVRAGTTNVGAIKLTGGAIALINCDETASIRSALEATGLISASDLTDVNACGAAPTLASLSNFSAVLVWSNSPYGDPVGLGNVLANFVDAGGGVVLATYSFTQSWRIDGRILTPGYSPFGVSPSASGCTGNLSLANSNTSSVLMQGVSAGPYFCNFNYTNPPLQAGATVVAVDTAGNRVVAVGQSNRVVGVSIFPGFGDMGQLFANALNFVR
jgi:hypothetical protein